MSNSGQENLLQLFLSDAVLQPNQQEPPSAVEYQSPKQQQKKKKVTVAPTKQLLTARDQKQISDVIGYRNEQIARQLIFELTGTAMCQKEYICEKQVNSGFQIQLYYIEDKDILQILYMDKVQTHAHRAVCSISTNATFMATYRIPVPANNHEFNKPGQNQQHYPIVAFNYKGKIHSCVKDFVLDQMNHCKVLLIHVPIDNQISPECGQCQSYIDILSQYSVHVVSQTQKIISLLIFNEFSLMLKFDLYRKVTLTDNIRQCCNIYRLFKKDQNVNITYLTVRQLIPGDRLVCLKIMDKISVESIYDFCKMSNVSKVDFVILEENVNNEFLDNVRPVCDYVAISLDHNLGRGSLDLLKIEIPYNYGWVVTSRYVFLSTKITYQKIDDDMLRNEEDAPVQLHDINDQQQLPLPVQYEIDKQKLYANDANVNSVLGTSSSTISHNQNAQQISELRLQLEQTKMGLEEQLKVIQTRLSAQEENANTLSQQKIEYNKQQDIKKEYKQFKIDTTTRVGRLEQQVKELHEHMCDLSKKMEQIFNNLHENEVINTDREGRHHNNYNILNTRQFYDSDEIDIQI